MAAVSSAARASAGSPIFASDNVRHLCRREISGGGQIVIQGNYAYIGHQHGPEGTTILDISDPRDPGTVSKLMASHPWSHSHKVRVVGDLMVVNSEIEPGKGDRQVYPDGGFRIYDIKDRTAPKLLAFMKTHARGVHRFDLDENFAYISTEMDGFVGNILVIYDIGNPSKPVEVSRWWMPGQNVAAGEPPHPKGRDHSLHHAMRCGNEMYAGCWFSGISIIDVSDIAHPRTLGPPRIRSAACRADAYLPEGAVPIDGRSIAVSTEEERPKRGPTSAGRTRRCAPGTSPIRPSRNSLHLSARRALPALSRRQRALRHASVARERRSRLHAVRDVVCGRLADDRHQRSGQPARRRAISFRSRRQGRDVPWTNDVAKDDRGLIFVTDKVCGLDVIEFDN